MSPSIGELRAVLEHAPMGVLVVSRSPSRILYANLALTRMLGYDAEALTGKTLEQLLPEDARPHHEAWMAAFFADPRQRRMGAGGELFALHSQGHAVPVDIALAPMHLDGQLCAAAYLSDRSLRRQMQRQFEQIFAAMPQGLLIVDEQGLIKLSNPALDAQFGYAAGELLDQPLEVLLPQRYRQGHVQHRDDYARQPTRRWMGAGRDLTALHKSGQEFPVEIALAMLDMHEGRHALAMVSDISLRKKAEAALQQTNAQLEEFTYVASHDLRSPLRGIGDLLSWIREDLPESAMTPSVVQNFERASTRIERAERMIDDLLEYARAGQRDQRLEIVTPRPLIDEVLSLVHIPPEFRVEVDVEGQPFATPRVPLSLSLRNLVGNAVKHHGGTQGLIRIQMREEGRFNVFTIEDDGQGIPAGADERIFKLFHRANTTTAGHGVGLAVTRRMINAHGGAIVVSRQGLLGGACFRVHWPRIAMKEVDDE
ncbi:sensor histidine kinase [Roseateles sp. DB2]|uniref:sensor histidine kinase n=1 Tax=Roseateles sp. DB2 TaxID=3453717 RepID=UPI003EF0146D